jgi:hypothetical protein
MKKDNYLREVLGLEINDGFPSGCLKKGREGRVVLLYFWQSKKDSLVKSQHHPSTGSG